LIAGRGSNRENIVQVIAQRNLPAEVCAVIANKADAQGIQWAQEQGIATEVVAHRDYATREHFDNALAQTVAQYRPDYVLLAGVMRVVSLVFIVPLAVLIINEPASL